VEDVQRGDPVQPPKRDTKYKSREFVDTDSDDDTTPAASGASTPSDKRSPSPPRGRRQKRARSEFSASPSPQRDTRRVVPRSPKVSSPVTSRAVTPPRATSPRRKQVRRVRFERGTKTTEGESSIVTPKEPAKPPAAKSMRQTATAKKDTRPKFPTSATLVTVQSAKVETPTTASVAASAKELLMSEPKIDAMTAIAKQAVANLKKCEVGVKFKEPPAKPEKEKPPAPKRH